MAQIEEILISCVTEAIRIFIILEYFKIFFKNRLFKRSTTIAISTYVFTLLGYILFHNVLVNLCVTIAGIIFLSLGFEGKLKKKILLSIMVYAMMFVIDLLASFLLYEAPDSSNYEIVSQFISVMVFYIVVIGVKQVFKNKGKFDFSGQWYLLLVSALLSIAAMYVVYKDMIVSRSAVITICIIVLVLNIMLYIFYMSMLDRFIYEKENLELKQQMNIYEQHVRSEIENSRQIRAIRHDMKHHIRELFDMLNKDKVSQAKNYLTQMNTDIVSTQNVYNTGHDAIDGILNYYTEKYQEASNELSATVTIPEDLEINIYDVNILLGNLLDNALENAVRDSNVNLELKYSAGMLHISISNMYSGVVRERSGHLCSRKGMNHGYGLENVKRIVEKYDGKLLINHNSDRFEVDIVMYIL